MKAGYSLWITNENGDKIFGIGPYDLLVLIDELGSLNKAAKEIKISYTKARDILNRAERELDIKLLEREVGGPSGGGSKLTHEAREIMVKYEEYRKRSSLAIEDTFHNVFNK
ncbi:MAG: LysR family transcriptional regulator [Tissierellia bacterium]|nr:LysR family transcriptional regulator [Tissierellia bacterium]